MLAWSFVTGIGAKVLAFALGTKEAAARFLNRETAGAIAAAVVAVAVVVGGAMAWHAIRSGAIEGVEAAWRAKAAAARLALETRARARERRAEDAAAIERDRLVDELRKSAAHAASLEAELVRLQATGADPVIYPQSLAKELRK